MNGSIEFAQAVVPGSACVIASVGDEQNALLMPTVEADLGKGPVTVPAARLYLLDEDEDQGGADHLLRGSEPTHRQARRGMGPLGLCSGCAPRRRLPRVFFQPNREGDAACATSDSAGVAASRRRRGWPGRATRRDRATTSR